MFYLSTSDLSLFNLFISNLIYIPPNKGLSIMKTGLYSAVVSPIPAVPTKPQKNTGLHILMYIYIYIYIYIYVCVCV
jgi:hypothetical protein